MSKIRSLYVIGSLRNDAVPQVAATLRKHLPWVEVFDDWYAAGPRADDHWKEYEQARGRSFIEALAGRAARNVFRFDKTNLDRCEAAVLVLPAGKSGHLELGYAAGCGKATFILNPEDAERWDVMYQFATGVVRTPEELAAAIIKESA